MDAIGRFFGWSWPRSKVGLADRRRRSANPACRLAVRCNVRVGPVHAWQRKQLLFVPHHQGH